MDWEQAVKECPSNDSGVCKVVLNSAACNDNVTNGKCPIMRLKIHEDEGVRKKMSDLISRKALLQRLDEMDSFSSNDAELISDIHRYVEGMELADLKPVIAALKPILSEPKPRIGRWIVRGKEFAYCSVCHDSISFSDGKYHRYCSECGSHMENW